MAGIIEKNKDTLLKDHLETLQMSDCAFLVGLFPDQVDQESKKLPTTAGFKIKVCDLLFRKSGVVPILVIVCRCILLKVIIVLDSSG